MSVFITLSFVIGSIILSVFTLIGIIYHHNQNEYRFLNQQLSITGNRNDFTHPKNNHNYMAVSKPEFFNSAFLLGGLLYLIGFILISDFYVSTIGIIFSIFVTLIGVFDLSNWVPHEIVVTGSQVTFNIMGIVLYIFHYNIWIVILWPIIIFSQFFYLRKKKLQEKEFDPNMITISQRVFIYLEILCLALIPYFV